MTGRVAEVVSGGLSRSPNEEEFRWREEQQVNREVNPLQLPVLMIQQESYGALIKV